MKLLTWIDLYLCEDADMAASIISEKLNLIIDEMALVKTIQVKKHYATWLSKETKALLNERDNAQKHAADTKNQDDWRLYKSLRNRTTSKMREGGKAVGEKSSKSCRKQFNKHLEKYENLAHLEFIRFPSYFIVARPSGLQLTWQIQ